MRSRSTRCPRTFWHRCASPRCSSIPHRGACAGVWWRRAEPAVRLFAASALLTLAGYFFVPYDQGHGWGYRYFHASWGALPLLAACALEHPAAGASLRRMTLIAALASLLLG